MRGRILNSGKPAAFQARLGKVPEEIARKAQWLLNHQDELRPVAAGQPILTGAGITLGAPSRDATVMGRINGFGAVNCELV